MQPQMGGAAAGRYRVQNAVSPTPVPEEGMRRYSHKYWARMQAGLVVGEGSCRLSLPYCENQRRVNAALR